MATFENTGTKVRKIAKYNLVFGPKTSFDYTTTDYKVLNLLPIFTIDLSHYYSF